MDEASPRELRAVRDLLERATVPEPPIGPMAGNALRAGIKLRRRRRARGIALGAAAVSGICAASLAVTRTADHPTAATETATVYVLGGSMTRGTVTPISAATNTPGTPIVVRSGYQVGSGPDMAITPDGKTIWVAAGSDTVTPISTVTKTAGKPIRIVHQYDQGTEQIVITPDGRTVYVLDSSGAVTPISTATNRPGKPIELGQGQGAGSVMAITPDGKTLYVLMFTAGPGPSYLIPIATATNTPRSRIALYTNATAIVVTPDGKTAYVVGQPLTAGRAGQQIEATPIPTATNTPGKPISTGTTGSITSGTPVVMTQDGRTIYIVDNFPNGVIPFSTVTNTPGKLIRFGSASNIGILGFAITRDGRTAYGLSQAPGNSRPVNASGQGDTVRCVGAPGLVTPIATAAGTAGKPITVGCRPLAIAVTPDGKTAYVASESGAVTPIATATGRPGKPLEVQGPEEIVIAP